MARARAGGAGSGYAWALVIFGAGFVICLLLAIIFFAQLGGARQQQAQAEGQLAEFVRAGDRARPELEPLKQHDRGVVGALLEQNQELKQLIAGQADATVETIQQELEALDVNVALLREIAQLKATLADARDRIEQAEQATAAQQQRAEQALQERTELAQRYTESVNELQGEIAQLQQDLEAYKGTVARLQEDLTQQFGTDQARLLQRIQEADQQLASANVEIERLRKQLAEATARDEAGVAKVAQTDAIITGLLPDQDRVFINRGAQQRVILGMTFEVYDDGELVSLEETGGELRGKGTVEVIDVRDSSSIARIVRVERGQSIDQGDQLVNIVYDPYATMRFFVYGDFDINNTGDAQVADRRRIENLITQWGGRLTEQLSYDVDFLVLGQEPPLPEPLPPGVIDPVRIAENVEAQRNYETYQELVGEARDLNIPILNQNRFLNLIGYYRR